MTTWYLRVFKLGRDNYYGEEEPLPDPRAAIERAKVILRDGGPIFLGEGPPKMWGFLPVTDITSIDYYEEEEEECLTSTA